MQTHPDIGLMDKLACCNLLAVCRTREDKQLFNSNVFKAAVEADSLSNYLSNTRGENSFETSCLVVANRPYLARNGLSMRKTVYP